MNGIRCEYHFSQKDRSALATTTCVPQHPHLLVKISRLTTQVVGSANLRRKRSQAILLGSETAASSCSTADADEETASYSWGLVSTNASAGGPSDIVLQSGRDPRVLALPSYTLGFAGSTYVFQLKAAFGGTSNTVNATGESMKALCYPHTGVN